MEGICGHYSTAADFLMSPDNTTTIIPSEYHQSLLSYNQRFPLNGSDELILAAPAISEATAEFRRTTAASRRDVVDCRYDPSPMSLIKAKIASHPYYPKLLQAYIDCRKVGAPPEMATLLDEIRRKNDVYNKIDAVSTSVGANPKLDEFMETYCDILVKYKSDLWRPLDEATSFLSKIETQLGNLCKVHMLRIVLEQQCSASPCSRAKNIAVQAPKFTRRQNTATGMKQFELHLTMTTKLQQLPRRQRYNNHNRSSENKRYGDQQSSKNY